MYPFVVTLDQDAEGKWQLPSPVLCERLPPQQVAKVTSCTWVHFYVGTIVGILFLIFLFSFSTSGVNGHDCQAKLTSQMGSLQCLQFVMVPCSYTR